MSKNEQQLFAWACLPVGWLETNCYLFWDRESRNAAVIDPGADGAFILTEIDRLQLHVIAIINTHGHGDHIGANQVVKESTRAPLYIQAKDSGMLSDPESNYSLETGQPLVSPPADHFVKAGDHVTIGQTDLEILETPGHTPGSICLAANGQLLFSGDTLFAGSVGRTDLPLGSTRAMNASLCQLIRLPETMLVLPGHGPATTIGDECRENPFLLEIKR